MSYYVQCLGCTATSTETAERSAAIAAWNRRAGGEREQQLEAENKRLRAALREIEDAPGSGEDALADVYHCVNIASAALAGQTEGERK